jgi:hypothetical protein
MGSRINGDKKNERNRLSLYLINMYNIHQLYISEEGQVRETIS